VTRAFLGLLLSLYCTTAWGQDPIYPAFPQPPAPWAYAAYLPMYQPQIYPGFMPYGYQSYGFGIGSFGSMNWLPPNPPSPYYVTPSGREYLQQAARRERATYTELKLQHQKQADALPGAGTGRDL
jgi:hypothetical protein